MQSLPSSFDSLNEQQNRCNMNDPSPLILYPMGSFFSPSQLCCLLLALQMAGLMLWCCCMFQGQVLPRSLDGLKCQGNALVSFQNPEEWGSFLVDGMQ